MQYVEEVCDEGVCVCGGVGCVGVCGGGCVVSEVGLINSLNDIHHVAIIFPYV